MGLVGIKKLFFNLSIYSQSLFSQEKDGRRFKRCINIFNYLTRHVIIPFYLLWFYVLSVSLSLTQVKSLFLNVLKTKGKIKSIRSMCIVGGVGVVLFFIVFGCRQAGGGGGNVSNTCINNFCFSF